MRLVEEKKCGYRSIVLVACGGLISHALLVLIFTILVFVFLCLCLLYLRETTRNARATRVVAQVELLVCLRSMRVSLVLVQATYYAFGWD